MYQKISENIKLSLDIPERLCYYRDIGNNCLKLTAVQQHRRGTRGTGLWSVPSALGWNEKRKGEGPVREGLAEKREAAVPAAQRLIWWEWVDSNHRSRRQQIYSLPPLATRERSHMQFLKLLAWREVELVDGLEPPTC